MRVLNVDTFLVAGQGDTFRGPVWPQAVPTAAMRQETFQLRDDFEFPPATPIATGILN